ncbi:hypothetical protein AAHB37_11195 [Glutamicibacter halophytocola]|uniref:hypothetical protein n=1 Tax=Glutamicibacter halophytocola TaxID=1933880 RepID=UPI003219DD0C
MTESPLLQVRLGNIAHGGHTVARHEGRVIFVRHGIPGELVSVRLTDSAPDAKFWRADVVEVHEASEHRVPHFWDAADALKHRDPVGGAEFGHISLEHQRELKARVAAEQFTRLAGLKAEDYNFPPVQAVAGADRWPGVAYPHVVLGGWLGPLGDERFSQQQAHEHRVDALGAFRHREQRDLRSGLHGH